MNGSEIMSGCTRSGTAYSLATKKGFDDWCDEMQQATAAVPVSVPTPISTFGCYANRPMELLAATSVAYFGADVAHDIIPVAAHQYI